jgi:hypothetical protein
MCLIGLVPLTVCASGYIKETNAEILTSIKYVGLQLYITFPKCRQKHQ